MKLNFFELYNYKSIAEIKIDIPTCSDGSATYGIIGENEAGKSSILKALALTDNLNSVGLKATDFNDRREPIIIRQFYDIQKSEAGEIKKKILEYDPNYEVELFNILIIQFEIRAETLTTIQMSILFNDSRASHVVLVNNGTELANYLNQIRHKTVFWAFDNKYLISNEINLNSFFSSPNDVSIPLKNCFKLAGYDVEDFPEILTMLNDSTEREDLRDNLGTAVTSHLKRVWKKHRVKITFDITQDALNFHIKDEGSKTRAKTVDQRSDGFKQFISFLLTVSAESANSNLKNTILLLDEPETHLHPKAQEDLLDELIQITKGNSNNILLFATHSNYLIDKKNLERNLKIFKHDDVTSITWFPPGTSSYASINYEVFGVASSDYHNELYDSLRERFSIEKGITDLGINKFDEEYFKQICKLSKNSTNKGERNAVTLPTFIRNCIHYPTNKNEKFELQLAESIELLKSYKSNFITTTNGG